MTREEYYKDVFLKASRESMEKGNDRNVYTFSMISALKEMARNDVWPDGRFGDIDCNVWSMLRDAY